MLFLLRMVLMGLHFIVAGVLGVLIGVCRPFNPDNSRLCARLYAVPAMWLLGLNVKADVDSLRHKPGTCVIIANHQSNYDLFVFGTVVPHRTVCIAKKSLKWVPLFGQLFWLAGNVLIDRGNAHKARRAMLTTTDTLQHKDTSIWVFPEGTRNLGKGLLPGQCLPADVLLQCPDNVILEDSLPSGLPRARGGLHDYCLNYGVEPLVDRCHCPL